jgi:hypothetical protein
MFTFRRTALYACTRVCFVIQKVDYILTEFRFEVYDNIK